MKMLILTSSAYKVMDKIAELLPKKPTDTSVAFIPTASDTYQEKPWVEQDRNALVSLGFKVTDVDVKGKTPTQLTEELSCDIIFIAGGNTFYLLQELKKSGADKIITTFVEDGTIFIGSSAGAAVAAPSIELLKELDHPEKAPELTSFQSLNLTSVTPLIHFGHGKFLPRYEKAFKDIFTTPGEYIGIRDDQALIITDDVYKIITQS